MSFSIFHKNNRIMTFADKPHAEAYIPILKANNRRLGVKGIKYHLRENKLIISIIKLTDDVERHV